MQIEISNQKPYNIKSIYIYIYYLQSYVNQMGNKACCEDGNNQTDFTQDIKVVHRVEKQQQKPQAIALPLLKIPVKRNLEQLKPFQDKLSLVPKLKKFGNDIYDGTLNDKGQPDGFGKLYYQNGNVFVGLFEKGIANGPAHFVLPDGSYYHGNMENNKAETLHGEFRTGSNYVYEGGFKNNKFHGAGTEKGNGYIFDGNFSEGRRMHGTLKWEEKNEDENGLIVIKEYVYKGNFDQNNKFIGKGTLRNEKGEYVGEFKNGKKNGKGEYKFQIGSRYEGDYGEGERNGTGILYKKNGTIAYSGDWKNGLPNGKGYVINEFGDKVYLNWAYGLDEKILPGTSDSDQMEA